MFKLLLRESEHDMVMLAEYHTVKLLNVSLDCQCGFNPACYSEAVTVGGTRTPTLGLSQ